MKTRIFFAVLMLSAFVKLHAQKDFQGMAVYESKTSTSKLEGNIGGREITPEMRKMFEERMKKINEKTFILNFDKSASIYKEEEKLELGAQSPMSGRMVSSMMGAGGTFYKNIKDKTYIVDKEFMGKEFLIKDSLPKLDWKMESETRQIGGYTCFKATAVRAVSQSDFRNMRFKRPGEDKKETGDGGKPKEEKSTNFFDSMEMPKEVTVTAWYTPEIPVSQGPENYWGLPGLILEVNDGKTTILCSKVVLNVKEKADIKPSKNGKQLSQTEYDKIVLEKMEEFRNARRDGRGRFGG